MLHIPGLRLMRNGHLEMQGCVPVAAKQVHDDVDATARDELAMVIGNVHVATDEMAGD